MLGNCHIAKNHYSLLLNRYYFRLGPCELYGLINGTNNPTFGVTNIAFICLNGQRFNLKDILISTDPISKEEE